MLLKESQKSETKEQNVADGLNEIIRGLGTAEKIGNNRYSDVGIQLNDKTDKYYVEVKLDSDAPLGKYNCQFSAQRGFVFDFSRLKKSEVEDSIFEETKNSLTEKVQTILNQEIKDRVVNNLNNIKDQINILLKSRLKEKKGSLFTKQKQIRKGFQYDAEKLMITDVSFPLFFNKLNDFFEAVSKEDESKYESIRSEIRSLIKEEYREDFDSIILKDLKDNNIDNIDRSLEYMDEMEDDEAFGDNIGRIHELFSLLRDIYGKYHDMLQELDIDNDTSKTISQLEPIEKTFYTYKYFIEATEKDKLKLKYIVQDDIRYKSFVIQSETFGTEASGNKTEGFNTIINMVVDYYRNLDRVSYIQIGSHAMLLAGERNDRENKKIEEYDILKIGDKLGRFYDYYDSISFNLHVLSQKDKKQNLQMRLYINGHNHSEDYDYSFDKTDKNFDRDLLAYDNSKQVKDEIDDVENDDGGKHDTEENDDLVEQIENILNESLDIREGIKTSETASNMFELQVADNIKDFLSSCQNPQYEDLSVSHYEESDSKYWSDISIVNNKNGKRIWVEAKKNKYSELGGPSFKFSEGQWTCTTTEENDPLAQFYLDALKNNSGKFIQFCREYLEKEDIKLPTDLDQDLIQAWKSSGNIEDTENDVQFITNKIPVENFGDKVAEFYKRSKNEPVYYMQVGDDLYTIDKEKNPLGLKTKDGQDLKSVSEAYRIGRIQFRAKGLSKVQKYYYSIVVDVKILSDKENQDNSYSCSFLTREKWPVVQSFEKESAVGEVQKENGDEDYVVKNLIDDEKKIPSTSKRENPDKKIVSGSGKLQPIATMDGRIALSDTDGYWMKRDDGKELRFGDIQDALDWALERGYEIEDQEVSEDVKDEILLKERIKTICLEEDFNNYIPEKNNKYNLSRPTVGFRCDSLVFEECAIEMRKDNENKKSLRDLINEEKDSVLTDSLIKTYPTKKFAEILVKRFYNSLQLNENIAFVDNDFFDFQYDGKEFSDYDGNPDGKKEFETYLRNFENKIAGTMEFSFKVDQEKLKMIDNEKYLAKLIEDCHYFGYDIVNHTIIKQSNGFSECHYLFESKFQPNDVKINDKLYHISPLRNNDKILSKGILPRSMSFNNGNKLDHSPRTYLFNGYNLDLFKMFVKALGKRNEFHDGVIFKLNGDFGIYEISREKIKHITLYRDNMFQSVNMNNPTALYTYEPIPPFAIKFINKFNVQFEQDQEASEDVKDEILLKERIKAICLEEDFNNHIPEKTNKIKPLCGYRGECDMAFQKFVDLNCLSEGVEDYLNMIYNNKSLNGCLESYEDCRYLEEGLIKTYPYIKFVEHLTKRLSRVLGLTDRTIQVRGDDGDFFEYGKNGISDIETFEDEDPIQVNFTPSMIKDGVAGRLGYDIQIGETDVNKILSILKDSMKDIAQDCYYMGYNMVTYGFQNGMIYFLFESKYKNDGFKEPEKLYHISPSANVDRIMTRGILPKSKSVNNGVTLEHPERVYLFTRNDENAFERFSRVLGKDSDSYSVIEIDYGLAGKPKLYSDNMFKAKDENDPFAVYTYEPIPPKAMKVIKTLNINENDKSEVSQEHIEKILGEMDDEQKMLDFIDGFRDIEEDEKPENVIFQTDIPESEVKKILNTQKIENERYDKGQFEKYYGQNEINWVCLKNEKECLSLAAISKDHPFKGYFFIDEIQTLRKGYGKPLIENIISKYKKVSLMANTAAGDSLIDYYRRLNLEEIVVEDSVYGCPAYFFCSKECDYDKLEAYFIAFYSNESGEEGEKEIGEAENDIGGEKSKESEQYHGLKIWIDDIREAPQGFKWIKSVREFIRYIDSNGCSDIGLIDTDHDAGEYQKFGGDYVRCFDYLDYIGAKNITIHIHSANPVGANNIRRIISKNKEDNGWKEIRNTENE